MSLSGSCLCGACRFASPGPFDSVVACHCTMCRKMSGHHWVSAHAPRATLRIEGPVAWFASSPGVRRGICPTCGSFLFWDAPEREPDTISFALGAVDGPTGLRLERHIFTADKGDYHDIADGLPQRP